MSDIRQCIISRWGRGQGFIVEADYSQLEVIGLAFLSRDRQLREDIEQGLDMHCLNASLIYSVDYAVVKAGKDGNDPLWVKRRKSAKAPGFLIQYGGGAGAMAAESGLSVAECKKFIQNYYARYPGVAAWQKQNIDTVKLNRRAGGGIRTPKGVPAGISTLGTLTGRLYTFTEGDVPTEYQNFGPAPREVDFAPTQIKNYPVQGFATGDIVPEVCGRLHQELLASPLRGQLLPINTVHDSIVFDCHADVLEDACPFIEQTMLQAPAYLKDRFNIDFDMELPVEVSVGPDWGTLINYREV